MYEINARVLARPVESIIRHCFVRERNKKLDLCCERFINRTESTAERPAEMVSIAGRATKVTR